jgi:hypothetical protein
MKILWCEPTPVSQQALSQRFLTFPAEIFERIFRELLPEFEQKWHSRNQRPLPESIQFARTNPANQDLGIIKSIRKPFKKLIIAPFPERTSREGQLFFEPSAQTCLTTAIAP